MSNWLLLLPLRVRVGTNQIPIALWYAPVKWNLSLLPIPKFRGYLYLQKNRKNKLNTSRISCFKRTNFQDKKLKLFKKRFMLRNCCKKETPLHLSVSLWEILDSPLTFYLLILIRKSSLCIDNWGIRSAYCKIITIIKQHLFLHSPKCICKIILFRTVMVWADS